jgi:hypothetical protein
LIKKPHAAHGRCNIDEEKTKQKREIMLATSCRALFLHAQNARKTVNENGDKTLLDCLQFACRDEKNTKSTIPFADGC